MSKVVVLGAGVSGHTAALTLRRKLSKEHEVIVVSPNSRYQWIPSNIWVGIGRMNSKQVTFELAPVYRRKNITFHQAKAVALFPEGTNDIYRERRYYDCSCCGNFIKNVRNIVVIEHEKYIYI
jgi:NADH dehydrogenase FAD-containing subunit